MTTCARCGADTHRDFPDKSLRCGACDRRPLFCRCAPTESKREPIWLQRARTNGFIPKDFTQEAVA